MLAARDLTNSTPGDANQLLNWFSETKYPMSQKVLRVGALSYYQFASSFEAASDRRCGAYGRSTNRRTAAIKCAAELVERRVMLDFFSGCGKHLLPPEFHTSNGWAVHFEKAEASRRAYLEALERHLLLKSYLSFGWEGFRLHQKICSPEMDLYLLLSRFAAKDLVSAMVVARSPLHPGVSFGFGIGRRTEVDTSLFWEAALFEAVDRPLVLRGEKIDLSLDPKSWLASEAKYFLENEFDLSILGRKVHESVEIESPQFETREIEVGLKFGMPFSFHATFAWGGDLIPLFHKKSLSQEGEAYLLRILRRNGLSEILERHPIL